MDKELAQAKQSLTLKQLPEPSKDLWLRTAGALNQDKGIILAIGSGRINPIHGFESEVVNALLLAIIQRLSQVHGAVREITEDQAVECVELVKRKHNNLGFEELPNAYRIWVDGDIAPAGADMFHGQFTPIHFGRILKAYQGYRQKVSKEYRKQEQEKQKEEEEKQAAIKREQFKKDFPVYVAQRATSITTYEDVPHNWFSAAIEVGLFEHEFDQEIYDKATVLAFREIKDETDQEPNKYKRQTMKSETQKRVIRRSQAIYEKMYVYKYLIINKIDNK